jgi:hypothetical protein
LSTWRKFVSFFKWGSIGGDVLNNDSVKVLEAVAETVVVADVRRKPPVIGFGPFLSPEKRF